MRSHKMDSTSYPGWVRIAVCLTPFVCVLAVSVGAALGTTITWGISIAVGGLCVLVIRQVV